MDKRIRRNELCVIGLPRCDFVFSSTRTCFIAYGFNESKLEMTILSNILENNHIQPIEAGGSLAPGQSAFCAKICSKIIISQFCVVLLNNEENNGREIPNANVNMEYGLMLGFNKYVIPFQREIQHLPFNVSGLDTIKYTNSNFESKAKEAIEQAILDTQQDTVSTIDKDQRLNLFLIAKGTLMSPITDPGERSIYQLGEYLGFNLLNDFSGMSYIFLGNFPALRSEIVLWRVQRLLEILSSRYNSIGERLDLGIVTDKQAILLERFMERLEMWIIVTSDRDKDTVEKGLPRDNRICKIEVFSLSDVEAEINKLGSDLKK